jgi:hypothetical protein
MTSFNLYEAYAAVYDDNLRQELLSAPVKEDFSFIDDLSDNELVQVMEEILSEGEVTLEECFDAFDEVLIEATVTSSEDRPSEGSSRVTSSSDRRSEKTAERRKKVRVGRVMQAAERAGEKIKGGAKKTKEKVTGRLASAKEKITGFLGKIGRSLKVGASAAKKEFSGEAGREASARTTGRQLRRAARNRADEERGKDTSAFDKPNKVNDRPAPKPAWENLPKPERITTHSGGGVGRREAARSGGIQSRGTSDGGKGPSSKGRALPPVGAGSRTPGGKLRRQSQITFAMSKAESKGKKLLNQEYDLLASYILEDIINEGYANTFEEAFEVFESFSDYEICEIAENYLVEETETVDVFDCILEYLVTEGYADTNEAALVIMANMSEEWREEILDEANRPEREMIKKGLLKSSQVGRVRNLERDSAGSGGSAGAWYGQDPRDQPSIQRPGRSFGRTGPNKIKQRRQKDAQQFDAFYTSQRRDEHDKSRGKKTKG